MTATNLGLIDWGLECDEEGHRVYTAKHRVKTSDPDDGPNEVFNCPGLPLPGVSWAFGNDADPWAFCYPNMSVRRQRSAGEEPSRYWETEQTFSTRPLKRCQDTPIENPLNEPPKIRGSFSKFTVKATHNRNGFPVVNTAFQPLVGPETEFDASRPTVSISMNVPTLPLALYVSMVDTVNDANLWGLGPRRIKLSNVSWERNLYGTCNFYYTINYEFEINYNTFDRIVPSLGSLVTPSSVPDADATPTKDADGVIDGDPPAMDPEDYEVPQTGKGARVPERVFLNEAGKKASSFAEIAPILISYYRSSNFLLLGIPTSF